MTKPLLAVDAPYVLYRSFFALPDSIVGVDKRPVNALLGATNVILRIAADHSPRAIVVCFGAEAAKYRKELFPPYHADRPEPPEALGWQIAQAPGYFEQFGWQIADTDAFEADDLLHSLAAGETAAQNETLLLTGDRDMYQCVSDRVKVLYLKQGTSGSEELGPKEVEDRYGIPPHLVPDFIALRGDPSDSLPGAPGIGPKTAAELLNRYGSLEHAIAQASAEKPRTAAALTDNAQALRDFKEIAKLRDVPIDRPPDRPTELKKGAKAARKYGMNRLAERLEQAQRLEDL